MERFIGILIEHYAGAFPLWLAPKQIEIIPVNNEYHLEYSEKIKQELTDLGFRVSIDHRDEKLGYRLREAQIMKVPVQLIIGDDEVANSTINVRRYGSRDQKAFSLNDYVEILQDELVNKK